MTKGTKIFRIIVCTLLALTMIFSAFFAFLFAAHISKDVMDAKYGVYVAGVAVTRGNKSDVLGDGTVYYNATNNVLTFNNATIESENTIVYSQIDLTIALTGENKFICTNEDYSVGVYAGDNSLSKDLALRGDGSLTIEFPNASVDAAGIFAANLTIATDVTIITSDCENKVHGIACDSSLAIITNGNVTVNNGAARNSVGVRVRGNTLMDAGTALHVSVKPGTTEICRGLSVSGDLVLSNGTSLEVSIDDAATNLGECIRVSGLMEIGNGSAVTALAKNAYAIECFRYIEANQGADISAVSDKKDADIFCGGAVVNYGAFVNAEIEALGGVYNKAEN